MAPKKTSLRAVGEGEVQPSVPEVHAKIEDALEGSARDMLASMRKALARKLDAGEISSNAIASTYKELRELDRLIRAADAEAQAEEKRDGEDRGARRTFNPAAI